MEIQRPSGVNVGIRNPGDIVYVKGDENTDGSFRITISTPPESIRIEERVAGVWVLSDTETGALVTYSDDGTPVVLLANEGTNGGISGLYATDRTPVENIPAPPGSVAFREGDALSSLYLHKGIGINATAWRQVSVNPSATVEVHSVADLDINITGVASTTGTVTTVTGQLTLKWLADLTTDQTYVMDGGLMAWSAEYTAGSRLQTTTTGTLLSGTGSVRIDAGVTIEDQNGLAEFLDLTGGLFNMEFGTVNGFGSLGTFRDGVFLLRFLDVSENLQGFTLVNTNSTIISVIESVASVFSGSFIDYMTQKSDSTLQIDRVSGTLGAGQSVIDIDPRTSFGAQAVIDGCKISGGDLFKRTDSATIAVDGVADSPVTPATITAMAASGEFTTVTSAAHGFLEDEQIRISGTVAYNGAQRIFNVTVNTFDIPVPFVTDEATGTAESNRIILTVPTGHGVVVGDDIGLTGSDFYNGFYVPIIVTATEITVNNGFVATDSCILSVNVGLDQSDFRVLADANIGFASSRTIASEHIEENLVLTVVASTDTYQDMNLSGSTGAITSAADNGLGQVRFTTGIHGLVPNQNVKIRGTSIYNGEYRILAVPNATTFDIDKTFVDTRTGDWDAHVHVGANIERFRLTDPVTGELQYTDVEPFDGNLVMSISATKKGNAETYIFSLAKNGIVEGGQPFGEREINQLLANLSVLSGVSLVPGDRIKPQVAAIGAADNLTIQTISLSVQ